MTKQIKDCQIQECVTCHEDQNALEVSQLLKEKGKRYAYVLKNGFPVGVISAIDFVNKVVADQKDPSQLLAKDFMTFPIDTLDIEDYISKAFLIMNQKSLFSLPVVEGGNIKGMVSFHEILRILNEEKAAQEQ